MILSSHHHSVCWLGGELKASIYFVGAPNWAFRHSCTLRPASILRRRRPSPTHYYYPSFRKDTRRRWPMNIQCSSFAINEVLTSEKNQPRNGMKVAPFLSFLQTYNGGSHKSFVQHRDRGREAPGNGWQLEKRDHFYPCSYYPVHNLSLFLL